MTRKLLTDEIIILSIQIIEPARVTNKHDIFN